MLFISIDSPTTDDLTFLSGVLVLTGRRPERHSLDRRSRSSPELCLFDLHGPTVENEVEDDAELAGGWERGRVDGPWDLTPLILLGPFDLHLVTLYHYPLSSHCAHKNRSEACLPAFQTLSLCLVVQPVTSHRRSPSLQLTSFGPSFRDTLSLVPTGNSS